MNKIVPVFGLKLAKKKKIDTSSKPKRVSKKVEGYCFIEDGVYKVHVELQSEDAIEANPGKLLLEFTEDSYDLKGHEKIFIKCKDHKEKWICYCRTKDYATSFPGDKSNYVPFAHNWIVEGYIVRVNKQLMFEFTKTLTIKGYDANIQHNEDK